MDSLTKKCPFCAEEINAEAKKCKHCGEYLDPVTRESMRREQINDNNHTINLSLNGALQARSNKSRLTYVVLGLFLGMLGFHNFYAGRAGSGICQLILTCTVVGMAISGIWVLLDLLFTTTDGTGAKFI